MCDVRPPFPDLSFPNVKFGARETPWNLNVLLYKGGADAKADLVAQLIASGALGDPQLDRLKLVCRLHEEISAALESGGSRASAVGQLRRLRSFFGFADRMCLPLTVETATDTYCAWADSLVHRARIRIGTQPNLRHPKHKPLSMRSAYSYGAAVGMLLDRALERHTRAVEMTRLESPRPRKTAVGVQAEKQNLSDTFAFGRLLLDITDELTIQTILAAPLPLQLKLRNGKVLTRSGSIGGVLDELDGQLGARYPLANLRIEAELLMFIAQTGMNLEQANSLELRHFFYVSHLDGYHVKEYKARRGGTVLFEIFKDYKAHFERYLGWRRALFPHSNRLFPFVGYRGSRPDRRVSGHRLRAVCKKLDIPFVSPRSLRHTRVNWLLRITADPNLTAEMAQHAKQTLLEVYERPSLQRAMGEVTRFWSKFDPHSAKLQAVAPGNCTGTPKEVTEIPKYASKPDCTKASGCLWCENHRDVDSLDHVWALATFKHLKIIELSKVRLPQRDEEVPPAKFAIDRINDKLRWYEQSSEVRRTWVEEAQARVTESDFHPQLRDEITELEGAA